MAGFRASLGYVYLSKYVTLILQFTASIVLARLLTPADIGIYTVAAVFVGLGHLLREFGINQYIVQEKELTADRFRAAFTLNTLFGWSIALILFLAREPIGAFYKSEAVSQVVGLLCINFLLVPMGAITFAHIRREMRFHHTVVIQVGSSLVQAIVVITAAWFGAAYLSMVWSAIASTATSVLLTFVFRAPGLPLLPGFREIPRVLAFCKYAGPNALVNHAGLTAPDWILGKVLGMSAVGLYSRASGTVDMFNKALMEGLAGVTLPHFAKQNRENGVNQDDYLKLVASVTGLAWPFFATLAILADPLVHVLFGTQWTACVPPLRVLCAGAMLFYTTVLVEQLLVATGRVRLQLILNTCLQILSVTSVVASAAFGIVWVAAGLATVEVVRLIANQTVSQRILTLGFARFLGPFTRNLALTALTITPPLLAVIFVGESRLASIWALAGVVVATGLAWLAGVRLTRSPLWAELLRLHDNIRARLNKSQAN